MTLEADLDLIRDAALEAGRLALEARAEGAIGAPLSRAPPPAVAS